jgi:hypothetical protein
MEKIMLNAKRVNRIALFLGGSLLLAAQGCNSSQPAVNHAEQFAPPGSEYASQRLAQTQEAAGARADATLYPQHFDGPGLSTLGMYKLDLMLQDSHTANPLVVYVSIPDDEQATLRRRAITDYVVHHSSVKADQISLQAGTDPGTLYLTGPNLKNYDKTDTASDSGSYSGGSSSSSSTSATH